jgi:hypothetical protein
MRFAMINRAWILGTNTTRKHFYDSGRASLREHINATYLHIVLQKQRGVITAEDLRDTWLHYLEQELKAVRDEALSNEYFLTYHAPQRVVLMQPLHLTLELQPEGIYRLDFPEALRVSSA